MSRTFAIWLGVSIIVVGVGVGIATRKPPAPFEVQREVEDLCGKIMSAAVVNYVNQGGRMSNLPDAELSAGEAGCIKAEMDRRGFRSNPQR
jgi:hypothetical protein